MRKCRYCKNEFLNTDPKQIYCSPDCRNGYWRDKKNASNNRFGYPKVDDLEGEIWKEINEYNTIYKVSNLGRIKSIRRVCIDTHKKIYVEKERLLKPVLNRYYVVCLKIGSNPKHVRIHRIIAKAFIPNPLNKPEVNHIDGNKQNNEVTNLEWVTRIENMEHAVRTGLITNKNERNFNSKLNSIQVSEIKQLLREKNSQYMIAKKYNISRSAIKQINLGQTWSNIK